LPSFREFERTELCMGTAFQLRGKTQLTGADLDALLDEAWRLLHEADEIFSLYQPDSPLSQLGRGETSVTQLPPVVSKIWDDCEAWEKTTSGYFSALTPERTFDPSGLVKTWASRNAAAVLAAAGLTDFTINAGGDIYISAGCSTDLSWRIGIHKPTSIASPDAGVLTVVDLKHTEFNSLATSGYAERGLHIWNPKAAMKAANPELLQVSVISDDLVRADVWATAAMAAGFDALRLLNEQPQLEALLVAADGSIAATDGFTALLAK
jgi:thiamine biosynthesis lipoprotein